MDKLHSFHFFILQEVRELLADWDVQSVLIQAGGARVTLCNPEVKIRIFFCFGESGVMTFDDGEN
jgi:hypothetical protein